MFEKRTPSICNLFNLTNVSKSMCAFHDIEHLIQIMDGRERVSFLIHCNAEKYLKASYSFLNGTLTADI